MLVLGRRRVFRFWDIVFRSVGACGICCDELLDVRRECARTPGLSEPDVRYDIVERFDTRGVRTRLLEVDCSVLVDR